MQKDKVFIIGISPGGASSLPEASRSMIENAEMLFGGSRLLQMFPSVTAEKIDIKNNLNEVVSLIEANLGIRSIVVVASGDPGFFGIARYLINKLGKDVIEIIPNVSAIQIAFARIKENWDDAVVVSAHSRKIEDILETIEHSDKVGILTNIENTPGKIALKLRENGWDNCQVYICQDIGGDKENIVKTDLKSVVNMSFSPLNIMILIRDNHPKEDKDQQILGIADDEFVQRKDSSLITKMEVRAISLSKMCLHENSVVWDIGAGSGSISIEASILVGRGHVCAIEKNDDDIDIIRENIRKFSRNNIDIVQALAPDKLDGLPDPDAIFIGGSGGNLDRIIDYVCRRLKTGGRPVCNIATLENLHIAVKALRRNGFKTDITQVNIARSKDIADLTRLEPLNPVFVVTGIKEKEKEK